MSVDAQSLLVANLVSSFVLEWSLILVVELLSVVVESSLIAVSSLSFVPEWSSVVELQERFHNYTNWCRSSSDKYLL